MKGLWRFSFALPTRRFKQVPPNGYYQPAGIGFSGAPLFRKGWGYERLLGCIFALPTPRFKNGTPRGITIKQVSIFKEPLF